PDLPSATETASLASGVDVAPTILDFAGVDNRTVADEFPALHGHSLAPACEGRKVRDGVLTAVEAVTYLDADFWKHFSAPDVAQPIQSGELRPDWRKRGFLRGYTDERYSFGRYFSPLEPNRPTNTDSLFADNDVVLYDRHTDSGEVTNLAGDANHRD